MNTTIQEELESMAESMAKSILEKNKKDNLYKFYIILFTILSFNITIIIFAYFFYLNEANLAFVKSKAISKHEAPDNNICFNRDYEHILKTRRLNGVLWVYKTYHHSGELVYVTTAK